LGQGSITSSENLVLGLLGGLRVDTTTPNQPKLIYDPRDIGSGPRSLSRSGTPKQHEAFIEATNLSWQDVGGKKTGQFFDHAGSANDSVIPEFVDLFADPLPILYLRARVGQPLVAPTAPGYAADNNGIITYDKSDANNRAGQYDLYDLLPYTNSQIGEGKSVKRQEYFVNGAPNGTSWPSHGLRTVTIKATLDKNDKTNYAYPYDAFPYFSNPQSVNAPRAKDSYILISAGPDRVYGTNDDICSFGSVLP
jgi:hypothetical protein